MKNLDNPAKEKSEQTRVQDNFGDRFTNIEPVEKGWSGDKKYCVVENDTKYLLRMTPPDKSDSRKEMFEMMQHVSNLGVPMCQPVEFGTFRDGVFSLQSWIDGVDLEDILPSLSEAEQYVLGLQSGKILKIIHSIPVPDTNHTEDWAVKFSRKTDLKIQKYQECGIRFEGDDAVITYLEGNRKLLENRPQCFQHGDYHVGNMMLENGELRIIDFDRYDFGDPWEEFNRIVWCAQKSPHFATGQLRGYFGDSHSQGAEPPLAFFKLLAFYIGSNMLSSIYWALDFDNTELDVMMNQVKEILIWYDNMKNPVPSWYLKDFYIRQDEIPAYFKQTILKTDSTRNSLLIDRKQVKANSARNPIDHKRVENTDGECWDIYDADRNLTGRTILRSDANLLNISEFHLAAFVYILRSDGRFLITKRSPEKKTFPNMWEIPHGAVQSGESSLDAAIREAFEECGIVLKRNDAKYMGEYRGGNFISDKWLFRQEFHLSEIVLQEGETCDARACTPDEIHELIKTGSMSDYVYNEIVQMKKYIEEEKKICE